MYFEIVHAGPLYTAFRIYVYVCIFSIDLSIIWNFEIVLH